MNNLELREKIMEILSGVNCGTPIQKGRKEATDQILALIGKCATPTFSGKKIRIKGISTMFVTQGTEAGIELSIEDLAKQLSSDDMGKLEKARFYTLGKPTEQKDKLPASFYTDQCFGKPIPAEKKCKPFPISKCCNASVEKVFGGDGTCRDICQACNKACDLAEWNKAEKKECEHEWVLTGSTGGAIGCWNMYRCRICGENKHEEVKPEPKPKDRIELIDPNNCDLIGKINEIIKWINQHK